MKEFLRFFGDGKTPTDVYREITRNLFVGDDNDEIFFENRRINVGLTMGNKIWERFLLDRRTLGGWFVEQEEKRKQSEEISFEPERTKKCEIVSEKYSKSFEWDPSTGSHK
jgi:hypothetical protein